MVEVFNAGQEIGQCLESASGQVKSEPEIRYKKEQLKEYCPGINKRFNYYSEIYKFLGDVMLNIVYAAAAEVGSDPEFGGVEQR